MFIQQSTLTCPHCFVRECVEIHSAYPNQFHQCPSCLRPYQANKNDCCIFCSYGDTPCNQIDRNLAL
ncbi:GDCCVxC domain-containing (seleno)protein [Polynucleobacter sp. UK-FUSCHL-C3]|uniref:GDCCVxC domain-containing (seleno)protein n=1 Tax=Polynucleobacter sp. UK-FUSCHL-C3 TaxID=2955208 RepID=UPI0033651A51